MVSKFEIMEVDSPEVRKSAVQIYENGRSKAAEVDGPKIFKNKNRRSKRMKVDGLKLLKWTVL